MQIYSFFEMNTFVGVLKKIYSLFILPYSVFLLYLMFFGFGRTQMEDNVFRMIPIVSTFIFIENSIVLERFQSLAINIFGNIIMFIPFGFLGFIFQKFQNFKTLMLAFLSILIIVEALQYFSRLGVFDVDDILLNSLGVWIGFVLFKRFNGKFNSTDL